MGTRTSKPFIVSIEKITPDKDMKKQYMLKEYFSSKYGLLQTAGEERISQIDAKDSSGSIIKTVAQKFEGDEKTPTFVGYALEKMDTGMTYEIKVRLSDVDIQDETYLACKMMCMRSIYDHSKQETITEFVNAMFVMDNPKEKEPTTFAVLFEKNAAWLGLMSVNNDISLSINIFEAVGEALGDFARTLKNEL